MWCSYLHVNKAKPEYTNKDYYVCGHTQKLWYGKFYDAHEQFENCNYI